MRLKTIHIVSLLFSESTSSICILHENVGGAEAGGRRLGLEPHQAENCCIFLDSFLLLQHSPNVGYSLPNESYTNDSLSVYALFFNGCMHIQPVKSAEERLHQVDFGRYLCPDLQYLHLLHLDGSKRPKVQLEQLEQEINKWGLVFGDWGQEHIRWIAFRLINALSIRQIAKRHLPLTYLYNYSLFHVLNMAYNKYPNFLHSILVVLSVLYFHTILGRALELPSAENLPKLKAARSIGSLTKRHKDIYLTNSADLIFRDCKLYLVNFQ